MPIRRGLFEQSMKILFGLEIGLVSNSSNLEPLEHCVKAYNKITVRKAYKFNLNFVNIKTELID